MNNESIYTMNITKRFINLLEQELTSKQLNETIVIFQALPEYESPRVHFELESDVETALSQPWFCARIEVNIGGVAIGEDYLGCCSYNSVENFISDQYCADMVYQALNEAKKELVGTYNKTKELLEK